MKNVSVRISLDLWKEYTHWSTDNEISFQKHLEAYIKGTVKRYRKKSIEDEIADAGEFVKESLSQDEQYELTGYEDATRIMNEHRPDASTIYIYDNDKWAKAIIDGHQEDYSLDILGPNHEGAAKYNEGARRAVAEYKDSMND